MKPEYSNVLFVILMISMFMGWVFNIYDLAVELLSTKPSKFILTWRLAGLVMLPLGSLLGFMNLKRKQ